MATRWSVTLLSLLIAGAAAAQPRGMPANPPTLENLRSQVRHLQRDVRVCADKAAIGSAPDGARQMSEALALAHWCESMGSLIVTQISGRYPREAARSDLSLGMPDDGSPGRLLVEARAVVAAARQVIARLRREPVHVAEEGTLEPSDPDVLQRYETP